MTQVHVERDTHGGLVTISAKGHATGSTEVCAAVSMMLYTIAGWLHNHPDVGSVCRLEDGDASILYYDRSSETRTLYEFAEIGFRQLAASYPDYISMT